MLLEQNGQGIRFFAGGAACHPNADLRILVPLPFDDLRDHLGGDDVERLRVPEGVRDADQQILVQQRDFSHVALQQPDVLVEILDPIERHPPFDPAKHAGELVFLEVDRRLVFQHVE